MVELDVVVDVLPNDRQCVLHLPLFQLQGIIVIDGLTGRPRRPRGRVYHIAFRILDRDPSVQVSLCRLAGPYLGDIEAASIGSQGIRDHGEPLFLLRMIPIQDMRCRGAVPSPRNRPHSAPDPKGTRRRRRELKRPTWQRSGSAPQRCRSRHPTRRQWSLASDWARVPVTAFGISEARMGSRRSWTRCTLRGQIHQGYRHCAGHSIPCFPGLGSERSEPGPWLEWRRGAPWSPDSLRLPVFSS